MTQNFFGATWIFWYRLISGVSDNDWYDLKTYIIVLVFTKLLCFVLWILTFNFLWSSRFLRFSTTVPKQLKCQKQRVRYQKKKQKRARKKTTTIAEINLQSVCKCAKRCFR